MCRPLVHNTFKDVLNSFKNPHTVQRLRKRRLCPLLWAHDHSPFMTTHSGPLVGSPEEQGRQTGRGPGDMTLAQTQPKRWELRSTHRGGSENGFFSRDTISTAEVVKPSERFKIRGNSGEESRQRSGAVFPSWASGSLCGVPPRQAVAQMSNKESEEGLSQGGQQHGLPQGCSSFWPQASVHKHIS